VRPPVRPPWYGGWYSGYWRGFFHGYHQAWLRGSWAWRYRPWFWTVGPVGAGWMLPPSVTFVYNNPFVVMRTIIQAPIDYSQPLPLPVTAAEADEDTEEPPTDPAAEQAVAIFDEGRAAFRRGDYATALARVDEAIKQLPSDATLHEFRALTLFAMRKFPEAAETIYAVLAAGPGWNWETLHDLYADPNEYTAQLRALEDFVNRNPDIAAGRFLLAYHYLVINAQDAAIRQLERVTRLQPDDQLSAELLSALRQGSALPDAPVPVG
jgi:tetratricopeptide (TPR) repeat protein